MVLAALQNGPHLDTYNAISRLIHVNIASAVQMIFLTTPASCNRPLEASLSYIQTVTYLKDARCVAVHKVEEVSRRTYVLQLKVGVGNQQS
eukprot:scaffold14291_cov71-Skeletonema_dohrnii-CCMP3373.AAC.1